MTMVEAARQALKNLGRPATAREIHDEIVRARLFTFGAKDPVSVLGGTLRRHTEGSKTLRGEAIFAAPSRGLFRLPNSSSW